MIELEPGYWGKEVACEYAGIRQRWLMVFSQAAQEWESKTLEKAQAKEWERPKKTGASSKSGLSTARQMLKPLWNSSTRNGGTTAPPLRPRPSCNFRAAAGLRLKIKKK